MNKEFVPYQESLALKELGFDEPCLMKIWWLNSVHKDTKIPFEPHVTMNGRDIEFKYSLPEKHPIEGFSTLELNIPTYSQAFRWFREKYGLSGWINEAFIGDSRQGVISIKSEIGLKYCPTTTKFFDTYEEAELACLKKLIEIVKEGNK